MVAMAGMLLHLSTAQGAPDTLGPLVLGNPDARAMTLLADRHLHDLQKERWNVYTQATYIAVWKLPFAAQVHKSQWQHTFAFDHARAKFHRNGHHVFGIVALAWG